MLISKEKFCEYLKAIEIQHNCEDDIRKISNKYNVEISVTNNAYEEIIVQMLELVTDDKFNDVDYFIYELDFGKKYNDGMVVMDGKKIDFSTSEKLYDYLEKNYKEKAGDLNDYRNSNKS